MKELRGLLHRISPLFRFIPFILLGVCFIEIFFYDSNPYSLYKIFVGGVDQFSGFGILGNIVMLYYFICFKHCWHSIVAILGMILLNIINSIVSFSIFIECLIYDLNISAKEELINYNDKIITPYDCTIIFLTFIISALLLIRNEIFKYGTHK